MARSPFIGRIFSGVGGAAVVGALVLPWAHNDITGDRTGLDLLDGHLTGAMVFWLILGAAAVATAAALARRRLVAGIAGAAALALLLLVACAVGMDTVRAIGQDALGRTIEPEATSTVAAGFDLAVAGIVLILGGAGLDRVGSGYRGSRVG